MAKRKNMGKVKRYNRSFYSGKQTARNIFSWLFVVALISMFGYFVAPYIIDFGTRTWYSAMDALEEAMGVEDEETPVAQATPTPAPTATPMPTPMPVGIAEGNWISVNLSALTTPELIAQSIDTARTQEAHYVRIVLKDTSGYIHYPSSVTAAAASIAATTVDPSAIVTAFKNAGIEPVAEIVAFQDPIAGNTDRSLAIQYADTEYKWLDNAQEAGGKSWLNPYADGAVQFVGDLIAELQVFGFEHICVSGLQFPSQVSSSQNFGNVGSKPRSEALSDAIAALDTRFSDEMILWYAYPYSVCLDGDTTIGGVLPSTLGAENLLLTVPTSPTEGNSTAETVADMVEALTQAGSESIVLFENNIGTFQ